MKVATDNYKKTRTAQTIKIMPRITFYPTIFFAFGSLAGGVNGAILWDWSFGSNRGTFTTTGIANLPGTYEITAFSVDASGNGMPVGSTGDSTYIFSSDLGTFTPFSLVWDGARVTDWMHSGVNSFDWVIFEDNFDNEIYYGWQTGNINTPLSASIRLEPSSPLSVTFNSAVSIPEPSSIVLFGLGGWALWNRRQRRKELPL